MSCAVLRPNHSLVFAVCLPIFLLIDMETNVSLYLCFCWFSAIWLTVGALAVVSCTSLEIIFFVGSKFC